MADLFDAREEACFGPVDVAAAETCYRELQGLSYQHAAAMHYLDGDVFELIEGELCLHTSICAGRSPRRGGALDHLAQVPEHGLDAGLG
jgi:hypothetical protein